MEREARCCNRYRVHVGLLCLSFGLRQCPGELESVWRNPNIPQEISAFLPKILACPQAARVHWDPLESTKICWDPLGFARTQNAISPEHLGRFTEDPGLPSHCENSLGAARVTRTACWILADLQGLARIRWDLLGSALKMQLHPKICVYSNDTLNGK